MCHYATHTVIKLLSFKMPLSQKDTKHLNHHFYFLKNK